MLKKTKRTLELDLRTLQKWFHMLQRHLASELQIPVLGTLKKKNTLINKILFALSLN